MSFQRFVYYCAVVGGWGALLAGLLVGGVINRFFAPGVLQTILSTALLGGVIAVGLNLLAGFSNGQWRQQLKRIVPGVLGGTIGGVLGTVVYKWCGLPQFLGWGVMGMAIGCADGLYERSLRKTRNGILGGTLGGLLGGLIFAFVASSSGLFGLVMGFVSLGVCIGVFIGLAQVVLKEAWVTVLDGFRPGRQVILTQPVTMLGRGDHLPLPFLGYSGRDLENEHLRISRQADGRFVLEDNHSRLGTLLNSKAVTAPVVLNDNDLIKLGGNIVRFNQRGHLSSQEVPVGPTASASIPAPPPPGPGASKVPPPPPQAPALPPFLAPTTPPAYRPDPPGYRQELRPVGGANPRIPPPPPPPPPPRPGLR
jgi:hypothetical protein